MTNFTSECFARILVNLVTWFGFSKVNCLLAMRIARSKRPTLKHSRCFLVSEITPMAHSWRSVRAPDPIVVWALCSDLTQRAPYAGPHKSSIVHLFLLPSTEKLVA